MREYVGLRQAIAEAHEHGYLGDRVPAATSPSRSLSTAAPAPTSAARRPRSCPPSRAGRLAAAQAALPGVKGLSASPPSSTTSNPVEHPAHVAHGGAWFAELGVGRSGGTRLLCVSGHVSRPGVYELPMTLTMRQVIDDVCGGVPGGAGSRRSSRGEPPCRPFRESELDVPVEFDALASDPRIKRSSAARRAFRARAGQAPAARWPDRAAWWSWTRAPTSRRVARIMRFYAHESCGQCTPCREGTGFLKTLLAASPPAPAAPGRGGHGRDRLTASPATPSARSATPPPGRCSAS